MAAELRDNVIGYDTSTNALRQLSVKQPVISIISVPYNSPKPTRQTTARADLVLDPSNVTQDFDLLRFEAAAFDQLGYLTFNTNHEPRSGTSPATSNSLISSPYNNIGHYLDLSTLSSPSRVLAKALTALRPTRPDYATAPYTLALNLDVVLSTVRDVIQSEGSPSTPGVEAWKETSFYVVVFRSKLKEGIDNDYLYKLDYESHREACESGGLLKYWFGKADVDRRNLATCFWHSREDAYAGGLGPWHKKARAAGRDLYERIEFSTYRFTILDGCKGFKLEE